MVLITMKKIKTTGFRRTIMNKYFFRMVFVFILVGAISLAAQKNPDAALDQTVFQAKRDNETLLHIHKPGRYSIQVKSEQGTRITIVDRMAGPYQTSGSAGHRDGRLDLLLDIGTYKIRLNSYSNGSGQVILKVFPFQYVKPVTRVEDLPYLPYLELIKDSLEDLQQQSFWIQIKERQVLRLEMLGRNLKDARLWRDGSWLEEANPTITTFERLPGQPITPASTCSPVTAVPNTNGPKKPMNILFIYAWAFPNWANTGSGCWRFHPLAAIPLRSAATPISSSWCGKKRNPPASGQPHGPKPAAVTIRSEEALPLPKNPVIPGASSKAPPAVQSSGSPLLPPRTTGWNWTILKRGTTATWKKTTIVTGSPAFIPLKAATPSMSPPS
jgi:hypothetical protein